ncbi:hypothetical protein C8Q76DRAFT_790589 [Earliella scabrosa]|nr:hypothetical protein C8Q76DRAFT_790589 [Earliella scabrosa]
MSAASTVSVSGDRMSIPRPSPTAAATLSSSSEPFPPPDSPSPATRSLLPDSGALASHTGFRAHHQDLRPLGARVLGHAVAPGPGGHAMDLDCAPPPPASELPSSSSVAEVAPAEGCASSASSVRGDVHIGGDVRASAPVREGTSGGRIFSFPRVYVLTDIARNRS